MSTKSVCCFAKTCGVSITPESVDKGKVTPASSSCGHAIPHVADWTCLNGICMRIAPSRTMCVEIVVPVKEPVVEPTMAEKIVEKLSSPVVEPNPVEEEVPVP